MGIFYDRLSSHIPRKDALPTHACHANDYRFEELCWRQNTKGHMPPNFNHGRNKSYQELTPGLLTLFWGPFMVRFMVIELGEGYIEMGKGKGYIVVGIYRIILIGSSGNNFPGNNHRPIPHVILTTSNRVMRQTTDYGSDFTVRKTRSL